ncbi:hypothetical protein HDU93_004458 [Gonapodya sp. JEL0774]|nr:hypothetical protein HDU93_004458 [Gonapodya sp. JEL0774]
MQPPRPPPSHVACDLGATCLRAKLFEAAGEQAGPANQATTAGVVESLYSDTAGFIPSTPRPVGLSQTSDGKLLIVFDVDDSHEHAFVVGKPSRPVFLKAVLDVPKGVTLDHAERAVGTSLKWSQLGDVLVLIDPRVDPPSASDRRTTPEFPTPQPSPSVGDLPLCSPTEIWTTAPVVEIDLRGRGYWVKALDVLAVSVRRLRRDAGQVRKVFNTDKTYYAFTVPPGYARGRQSLLDVLRRAEFPLDRVRIYSETAAALRGIRATYQHCNVFERTATRKGSAVVALLDLGGHTFDLLLSRVMPGGMTTPLAARTLVKGGGWVTEQCANIMQAKVATELPRAKLLKAAEMAKLQILRRQDSLHCNQRVGEYCLRLDRREVEGVMKDLFLEVANHLMSMAMDAKLTGRSLRCVLDHVALFGLAFSCGNVRSLLELAIDGDTRGEARVSSQERNNWLIFHVRHGTELVALGASFLLQDELTEGRPSVAELLPCNVGIKCYNGSKLGFEVLFPVGTLLPSRLRDPKSYQAGKKNKREDREFPVQVMYNPSSVDLVGAEILWTGHAMLPEVSEDYQVTPIDIFLTVHADLKVSAEVHPKGGIGITGSAAIQGAAQFENVFSCYLPQHKKTVSDRAKLTEQAATLLTDPSTSDDMRTKWKDFLDSVWFLRPVDLVKAKGELTRDLAKLSRKRPRDFETEKREEEEEQKDGSA